MNFLLEFSGEQLSQQNLPLTDIFSSGGTIFLSGILTVFAVLGILWVALSAFKFVFHDLSHGANKAKKEKTDVTSMDNTSVASDNNEIIAVIAAAIAMAENECGENKKFRVVSFKRK